MTFNKTEKFLLVFTSAAGLILVNGLFLYGFYIQTNIINSTLTNLFSFAFMIEAFILLPLMCFIIAKLNLTKPDWKIFLLLSLLGSIAFSLPLSLLLWERDRKI